MKNLQTLLVELKQLPPEIGESGESLGALRKGPNVYCS
jgi:hypothetical protein